MKYQQKEIKIQNGNKEIYGKAFFPITDKKTPFVIFSHGFNGRYKDFFPISEHLAERGIGSYGFDFCGGSMNSKSSLETTEMTIFTEKEDLTAVLKNVLQWDQVDKDNIILFGGSQGGFVSALTAEEYPDDVKALMMLFPAFCIPENWNSRFPELSEIPDTIEFWDFLLGRAFIESLHGFEVFDHIGKYDKDVIIYHGDKDDVVNIGYGEKAASIYENAEIVVFPGEGHGFSEEGNKRLTLMAADFIMKIIESDNGRN